MLELNRVLSRERRAAADDAGVALVVVVVVMLVGFIIVSSIAASVVFTIQANSGNSSRTQSFITAESWRDTAVAAITQAIAAGSGNMSCSGGFTVPGSTATNGAMVRWSSSTATPDQWSSLAVGGAPYSGCPLPVSSSDPSPQSNYLVIHSTGTAGGQTSAIDSVYVWTLQPDTRPAGTLAYFDGQFTATKSTYQGDLVIRGTSNYDCNNGAGNALQGDLWVTNASVNVTGDCYVTGNMYVYGYVNASNKNLHVGGDIITQTGDINLASDGVTVGGQLYAGHDLILSKSGTVGHTGTAAECAALTPAKPAGCLIGGTAKAVGAVPTPVPGSWTKGDGTALTAQGGQPTPTFTPTLVAVHDATAWLELDATKNLATSSISYPNASVTDVCSSAGLTSILQTPGTRAYIDMSGCVSGNAVTVQPNATNVVRDALIYVPSTTRMNVKLSNPITNGNSALNSGQGPELLFVHGDANVSDGIPSCTTGTGNDGLALGASVDVRTMIYSACGVNSTMSLTMTGQLYMGSDGLHLNGGTFECAPMGWDPAFKNLACGVKGDDGIFDPNRKVQVLGSLTRQTEQ